MAGVRIIPDLLVSDAAAAQAPYAELSGLATVMDHGWIATLAGPDRADLELSVMTHVETAPVLPGVSIQVDDLHAVYAAVVAAGLDIVLPLTVERWGVRRFFFRDLRRQRAQRSGARLLT